MGPCAPDVPLPEMSLASECDLDVSSTKSSSISTARALAAKYPSLQKQASVQLEEQIHIDTVQDLDDEPNSVRLNIYDLHSSMKPLNDVLQDIFSGGFYHVGVEVFGMEWMYAQSGKKLDVVKVTQPERGNAKCLASSMCKSGIVRHRPRQHAVHAYKRSTILGFTELSARSILALIKDMGDEFRTDDYHLIRKNCATFANAFALALGVGPIPSIFLWNPHFEKDRVGTNETFEIHKDVATPHTDANVVFEQVRSYVDMGKAALGPYVMPRRMRILNL
jgi:hypothetical protein